MKTHTFRNSTGACRVLPGGGVAAVIYAGVKPDRIIVVASNDIDHVVLRLSYRHEKIQVSDLEVFRGWSPDDLKAVQRLVDRVDLKMEITKRRKHGQCQRRVSKWIHIS